MFKSSEEYSHDLYREIALIKLLMNENDLFYKNISHPLLNKKLRRKKSLAEKYFMYLNSNEIWSLISKKTNCGNTFYQCINQAHANIFGFQPLDGQCYTKFKTVSWPCIMDYYQIDLHTLPSLSRYNNFDNLNKSLINYSHSAIKLFSIVAVRNLNNYSFQLSSNDIQLELLINKLVKDMIVQYQGQYITVEHFTEKHLRILMNSMINRRITKDQYPRGLYISSDESLFIWLMGNDHFRIISLSTTMNISTICKNFNTYLMFIENYLLKENHSFAFHSKFGYLTSSIEELSGFFLIIHCTIINEKLLEKVQEHVSYSISSSEPSTLILTNRSLLGLNDNEKLLRIIHAILTVLNNN